MKLLPLSHCGVHKWDETMNSIILYLVAYILLGMRTCPFHHGCHSDAASVTVHNQHLALLCCTALPRDGILPLAIRCTILR